MCTLSIGLAKPSGYICVRFRQARVREEIGGGTVLHQTAEVHEGGVIANAGRLLHVVSDDKDGVVSLEFLNEVFDLTRRDWIESAAGFVEQKHLGLGCDRTCDAKPLLLSSGESESTLLEAVFDFIPKSGSLETSLADFVEYRSVAFAVDAKRVNNVIVDAHGEGIRFLEDHSHPFAEFDNVDAFVVDRLAVETHVSLNPYDVEEIVHAVDAAKQRAFSAARRANHSGDFATGNVHRDVKESLLGAVPETEFLDLKHLFFMENGIVDLRFDGFSSSDCLHATGFDLPGGGALSRVREVLRFASFLRDRSDRIGAGVLSGVHHAYS